MSINSIKAVFFDLDGTLCYYRADRQKVLDVIANKLDIPRLKDTEYIQIYERIYRCKSTSKNVRVETFRELLKNYGLKDKRVKDLAFYLAQRYSQLWDKSVTLFPYTKKVLQALHNCYLLGLLTNGSVDIQAKKIARLRLSQYFDKVIISGSLGIHKPDPRVFDISLKEFNLQPFEAVHVGNSLYDDIAGAKKAGWHTIWTNREEKIISDSSVRPNWEIKGLPELLDILLRKSFLKRRKQY